MTENNNKEMDIDLKRMAERQKRTEQMKKEHESSVHITLQMTEAMKKKFAESYNEPDMTIFETDSETIEIIGGKVPDFSYYRVLKHQYEQFKWDPEVYDLLSLDTNAGLLLLTRKGNSDEDTDA